VAASFEPAANDGAVAIIFPSIGNVPSDFGYIVFDEDYGEAGVVAGENSALIIGCENDGGGSSDHVRIKSRLVVESDMSSSDPDMALQVKSGNTTSDLFSVSRTGNSYVFGGLGVGTAAPTTTGLIRATNDVIAFYGSDERLKTNIQPIISSLDILSQIGGYRFDWKPMEGIHENEGHDIGVIAQEIEKVLPEIVTTRENGYKAVKYEKIVALLIETNKELLKRVEELEKKLNSI
jgi:hypothetical protein